MNLEFAFHLTGTLICLCLFLQSFEFLFIEPYPFELIKVEIPFGLRTLMKSYRLIVILQLLVSGVGFFYPSAAVALVLLFTQWLIAVRWRGNFNGSSDAMTFLISMAWLVGFYRPRAALIYIAVQVTLSYVVAGLAKLRNREWRQGLTLAHFLNRPPQRADFYLSWMVMLFEVFFVLSPTHPRLALGFMLVGFVFHVLNAYVFGLNRFVFAWIAAYPALYWVTL